MSRKKTLKKRDYFGAYGELRTAPYTQSLFERLKDPEYAAMYLTEILENESTETLLLGIKDVFQANATNISKFSKKSGLSRQAVYHALSKRGNPRLDTLYKILKGVGLKITFQYRKKAA